MAIERRTKYDPVGRYLDDRVTQWRSGSSDGQSGVLLVLIVLTGIIFTGSILDFAVFPSAAYMIPVLVGGLLLRARPLRVLALVVLVAALCSSIVEHVTHAETTELGASYFILVLATGILVYSAQRMRSGLPATLGDAMLMDLRDRLQRQAEIPPLPNGWHCESVLLSAGGARFAGDFFAVNLANNDTRLEVVLVDVCGKGVAAGTQSLQLAGAMGGLIGSLPPLGLFAAANDYLMRQNWNDGFATAVHIIVDLQTGRYEVLSAGHPPALIYSDYDSTWSVDKARGIALGIMDHAEFESSRGVLSPGDALLIYTDGLVESREMDVGTGIEWLRGAAKVATSNSMFGATKRILEQAEPEDDDCAVFFLHRRA